MRNSRLTLHCHYKIKKNLILYLHHHKVRVVKKNYSVEENKLQAFIPAIAKAM